MGCFLSSMWNICLGSKKIGKHCSNTTSSSTSTGRLVISIKSTHWQKSSSVFLVSVQLASPGVTGEASHSFSVCSVGASLQINKSRIILLPGLPTFALNDYRVSWDHQFIKSTSFLPVTQLTVSPNRPTGLRLAVVSKRLSIELGQQYPLKDVFMNLFSRVFFLFFLSFFLLP